MLWYTFDDLNASMIIEDFSGFNTHGSVTSGKTVAGKFSTTFKSRRIPKCKWGTSFFDI